jgi:serine protease
MCSDAASGQYTVSGQIQVSPTATVDSDVNDPEAPYSPNDTIAQNQQIPMPGIAGGYVNNVGAGPVGRSKASGDLVDVYSVSLPAGATVTLYIAEDDGAVHDLDLFLVLVNAHNTGTIVDSSMGTERVESVTAPEDGNYYIGVLVTPDATEAATNYLLATSLMSGGSVRFPLRLGDEFVDGQVIVRFDDEPAVPASGRAKSQGKSNNKVVSLQARASSVGLLPKAGAAGRIMLMEMPSGVSRVNAMTSIKSDAARAQLEAVLPKDPALRKKLETLWMIKRLRRRPDVVRAEPNYLRRISATEPNDPLYESQWHYRQIDLPQAWDITTGNGETIVAVIDTGVLRDHPDLQGVLPTGPGMGYDFISSESLSTDGDGIDPDWNDTGNGEDAFFPSSFHGTHVTGTIAAATNNGVGVAGVNWNTKIMPLRALGKGGIGNTYDIQQAVLYAAGMPNDSGTVPDQRADIINLSLGGTGGSISEQNIYRQARDAGVIIIAAAGNDSSTDPCFSGRASIGIKPLPLRLFLLQRPEFWHKIGVMI